jgi:hypothetical protein
MYSSSNIVRMIMSVIIYKYFICNPEREDNLAPKRRWEGPVNIELGEIVFDDPDWIVCSG